MIGYNNFKYTEEQNNIINSPHESILVNGVPGSAKTTTLVFRLINKLIQTINIYNIIILTKVSNVTEELINRISLYLPEINFVSARGKSTRITAEYNGHSIEFSNYSAFIDSQLRNYQNDGGVLEYESGQRKIQETRQIYIFGNNHRLKQQIYNYLVKINKLTFKLKNGNLINKIILDEAQDFSQLNAIAILSIIKNNEISFEGYGDILQSIWYSLVITDETKKYPTTPINIYKEMESIELYPLSICFRLPFWHCEFLKIINKSANKKYNRKEIKSYFQEPENNEDKHKPMYFMHGAITDNVEAKHTAEIINYIIECVWRDVKEDITILATNVNTNKVFNKLESMLINKGISAHLFKTHGEDGENITIDMNKVKEERCSKCKKKFNKKSNKCKKCGALRKRNKIALISGHGFKGGESKCIIAFGLSEMSIPKANHPGTSNELNDISLFNVLNSRSKKYLFIGSNDNPSRYLTNNMENLSNMLYFVQDFAKYLKAKIAKIAKMNNKKKTQKKQLLRKIIELQYYYSKEKDLEKIKKIKMREKKNPTISDKKNIKELNILKNIAINHMEMPEMYKNICKKLIKKNHENGNIGYNTPLTKLRKIIFSQLNTPDRNILSITNIVDKSDKYNSLDETLKECVTIEEEIFGNPTTIEYTNADTPTLLGHLPNIVISIKIQDELYKFLKRIIECDRNVEYINENKNPLIIDFLKDTYNFYNFINGFNLLNIIKIIDNNDKYKDKNNKIIKKYKEIKTFIECLTHKYTEICPFIIFLPDYFKNIFSDFGLENNKKCWNLCLLYEYIFSPSYIECSHKINNDTEYFNGDLENCIDNIMSITNKLKDIRTEISCNNIEYIERDEKILKEELLLDNDKYSCEINGRIDGYIKNALFEFKISKHRGKCKKFWLLQVLLYNYLGIKKSEDNIIKFKWAIIYNFMSGEKYTIELDMDTFNKYFAEDIFTEILTEFNFPLKLKKNFSNKILNIQDMRREDDKEENRFKKWLSDHPKLVENMLSGLVEWKEHNSKWPYGEIFEEYKIRIAENT